MMKRNSFLLILLFFWFISNGQTDSVRILFLKDFISIVSNYHPVALQANLVPKQAKMQVRSAWGGFDPLIYANLNEKFFDGTTYYNYSGIDVKVPTWYGIELKTGFDKNTGSYQNPELKTPAEGLGYIGASVPIGKNLFMDQRRAALRQAKLFEQASDAERRIILNDVILDALKAYYDWWYNYKALSMYVNAVRLSRIRFELTKTGYLLGDRPAIDTIEALAQLQSRQFQAAEAEMLFKNSSYELSNFLWYENQTPVMADNLIPDSALLPVTDLALKSLNDLQVELLNQQPNLISYSFKIKQLEIERRLKLESVKPTVNLNYNLLSKQYNFLQQTYPAAFSDQYKMGVQLGFPLTFAQGRGDLALAKYKIQSTQWSFNQKTLELQNKLRSYYNEVSMLKQQIAIYSSSVSNYRQVFLGEEKKFQNDESSVFLVNARENQVIQAELKLIELQTKYFKSEAGLKWVLGALAN